MSVLTSREREILKAFVVTLIPGDFDRNKLVDKIDNHVGHFSSDVRLSFRFVLSLFDYGAIFYRFRFRTFRGLDKKWRGRYLEAWHTSWLAGKRALWRFLGAIVYSNYYSIPSVAAAVGYTPKFHAPLPEPSFPHENAFVKPFGHDIKEECEVCVIGSGAGGAAIAKTLAEAGRKVIILEDGGFFRAEDFGQDAVSEVKLLYRNGGVTNTFGYPAILVPVGKCVGGTTIINSGTCFRTPPQVLKRWADEFGLHAWSPEKMERYFSEVEKELGVEPAERAMLKNNTNVFKRGIESLGYTGAPLQRNAPKCCGSGTCVFGCPTNAKRSANLNYVPDSLKAGAKLYCHCRVSRFLYSGSHADTVIARFRDPVSHERLGTLEIKARVIILACGTFYTPTLLMRSHVPNPSGMIGHNLTIHPAAQVLGVFDEEIKAWNEIPQGWYVDALSGEGITFEGIFLPPSYTASKILHVGEKHREVMENYNKLASFGIMVSDTSHGRILRMPGGRALTIYNLNRTDVKKFIKGLEIVTEAFFAAGAKRVLLPIHIMPEITREEGATKLRSKKIRAKDLDLQAFHPLGTCRMGANPKEAVCDPYGRFYGLDNVFIADGSIFPTSLGVNPMVTIMAAAMKIGEYVDREVL
ncbi:MAG: hypothetical protein COV46_02970 [Deltaproteobacteria bacterium CG11_big_fil_rev_8_21_14_0_20_49_13]|nr:MAG: hypothetical protein COV46_02970 [Deltaproteobacteria bacterium CG11_big_fil_rev_8_21_14_0_20_49_13]